MSDVSLGERLMAITADVGKIKATGKSPFNPSQKALSISDVENALRPLLIKHKVAIRFSTRELTRIEREWKADVTAFVGNVPEEGEFFQADWADCGGTPAAAYSFARKSYLKQLFHIADTDDAPVAAAPRGQNTATARAEANGGTPTARLTTVSFEPIGSACPECGDGDLGLKTLNDGRRFIGCSHYPQCKFTRQPEAQTA